jgi:predicted fused transcriptional regulator/phosphomethylpyrimidine kinase
MIPMKDPVLERNEVLYRLDLAVSRMESSMSPLLVSGGELSLAYAAKGARDYKGVAAVPGGIVICGGIVTAGGPGAFGADEPCARIVLTAMKFDPLMRSAAIIPFSKNVLAAFRAMYRECVQLDTTRKTSGNSILDFGVAACCNDGVPDVIYDPGADKTPGIMYIFGEEPLVVANNIIICSNRI